MLNDVDLTAPQSFLRPFPDPAEVFVEAEQAACLLNPLVSIDLAAVDPAWSGWIHLVSPIEPLEGYIGEQTHDHHSYYVRENWIGFKLNDAGRYEFLGDWRYFCAASDNPQLRCNPELVTYYDEQHASYQRHRQAFLERGQLVDADSALQRGWDAVVPQPFLDSWQENPYAGNWADPDMFSLVDGIDDDYEASYPLTEDGRKFHYIGGVPGWSYRDSGADLILLFWDPVDRIALETFDWT